MENMVDFNTFLTEEIITEKSLDVKLKQFNAIADAFYAPDLVKFVKILSQQTGEDLSKKYSMLNESILDFIYDLDSSGAALKSKG